MKFNGYRGSMELTDTLLIISRKGEAEHSLPLSKILSVIIEKPGLTSNGLIHIQTVAAQGTSSLKTKIDYARDLNTVFFTKSSYQEALEFKKSIESALSKQNQNSTPMNQSDLVSQLQELKNLVEQGLITEEEYAKKKALILGI